MRRLRYAVILGCAAAMALAGCGKGVKDGTGQDKMSDGGSILQSYDSEIKLKDMDAKADAGVDIRYFVKDGKVYVCHRVQFENDGFWCGVSLDRIYGIDGESYVIEEIIVEEEYISGGW